MGNKVPYQKLDMAASDDVIPSGDPEKGAEIFREHCAGCHDIDTTGEHRAGPNLMALWGREANTIEGFAFVESDEKKGIIWNDKTLFDFLEKPHIPGTKFLFRDLKGKDEDKANLIAYLKKMTDPKNS
ncbi:cytochrome c, somatic-like isoform X1 [Lytechinus variegatus]|uniref:cytochrome c, somatic-like isoform X1 n=2 Tax=Lytechinus variegatus TaxID=7654 RepID=UPI001BB23809|nr:cytochrome c, somatic-like isoform X1 [Lytechinus variegatus]